MPLLKCLICFGATSSYIHNNDIVLGTMDVEDTLFGEEAECIRVLGDCVRWKSNLDGEGGSLLSFMLQQ